MTASNFARALTAVLRHEGGWSDHKDDPGGPTMRGVTLKTYRAYVKKGGSIQDLRNITDLELATVYRKQYWDAVKADALPGGIDYAVFDFAVNSGPHRAATMLQKTVGATADGVIGPETMSAVLAHTPGTVVDQLCSRRLAWLKTLKTWPSFKNGWTSRVNGVRKLGMEMAIKPYIPPPPDIPAPEPVPSPASEPGFLLVLGIIIAIGIAAAIALKLAGVI